MISDWAVSRAADCTLLVMNIDAQSDEGRQQSRRLHPGDNDNGGESGGDPERAVSRAADYTLLVLEIDAEFDGGCQQSRRLHPLPSELCRSSMLHSK